MTTTLQTQEEYQETELGPLPKEWTVYKFEQCLSDEKVRATRIQQNKFKPFGKYPIIDQGQELIAGYWNNEEDAYASTLPVIIFGDHTRAFKYIDFEFVCGPDGTKILIPNTSIVNPKYFYYCLTFLQIPSRGYNRHYSLLKERFIPTAPLPEQEKIAYVLSTIQEAQKTTDNSINSLKELKKSMMKHLFKYGAVSFEDAYNVKLKETEIGEIPESWEIHNLKDVGTFQYGYTETSNETIVGPKFLRITDIDLDSGRVFWGTVPYCKIEKKKYNKYSLDEGDILIARIGATTGKTCIIANAPDSVFASYLIRFKVNKDVMIPLFAYYFTTSESYWKQVNSHKDGKLKKGISSSQLKTFKIQIPSISEQEAIALIISGIDDKINAEQQRKYALEKIFNSMLKNLMTAKIRVADLEVQHG